MYGKFLPISVSRIDLHGYAPKRAKNIAITKAKV